MILRVGLIQFTASDQPEQNLITVTQMVRDAHAEGAQFIVTPEVTNCVSLNREYQNQVLKHQDFDQSLQSYMSLAKELGIWLMIGSLALKSNDPDGRFVNRSFLLNPNGKITESYDKIHMFDVALSQMETYEESNGYRAGDKAVVADCEFVKIGLSICYDVRFPHLFRILAQSGAQIITIPSAFSPVSGAAHWHVLLRARAIETGCYILAPAQTGKHKATSGKDRETYGHSLIVSPWGEIMTDMGTANGISVVDIDLEDVENARRRIPSLQHDRKYHGPK